MDNINLRTPKIRNIIGEVPPNIVRFGNVLLLFILCLLFLFALLVPLPWSESYSTYMDTDKKYIYIPIHYYSTPPKESQYMEIHLDIYAETVKPLMKINLYNINTSEDTVINKKAYYKGNYKLLGNYDVAKSKNLLKANLEIHYSKTPFIQRLTGFSELTSEDFSK